MGWDGRLGEPFATDLPLDLGRQAELEEKLKTLEIFHSAPKEEL